MDLIKINNLNFSYNGEEKTLSNINIDIKEKEITSIVGVNGCGKSTLVKLILGLLNTKNIIKNISVDKIGYLEQGDDLFPNLSVQDNINLIKSFYKSQKNMNSLIKKLDLEKLLKSKVKNLSGGQKKRLQLLLCFVNNPKLLILDEPTSEVDMKNAQDFWNFFKELKNDGLSIVVITHDLLAVKQYCDRCIFMNEGKIIKDSTSMKDVIPTFNEITGANYHD